MGVTAYTDSAECPHQFLQAPMAPPPPLRPCLVSICPTLTNVTQTTLASQAPFFRMEAPLYASYAPLCHVGAPINGHQRSPYRPHRLPCFAWRRPCFTYLPAAPDRPTHLPAAPDRPIQLPAAPDRPTHLRAAPDRPTHLVPAIATGRLYDPDRSDGGTFSCHQQVTRLPWTAARSPVTASRLRLSAGRCRHHLPFAEMRR